MAHRRRHDAAPREIHVSPEQSKHGGGDDCIPSLQAVARPERETVEHDTQPCAAKVLVEAMDDERTLYLFTKTTGNRGHQCEEDGLTTRRDQLLERILRNVME